MKRNGTEQESRPESESRPVRRPAVVDIDQALAAASREEVATAIVLALQTTNDKRQTTKEGGEMKDERRGMRDRQRDKDRDEERERERGRERER